MLSESILPTIIQSVTTRELRMLFPFRMIDWARPALSERANDWVVCLASIIGKRHSCDGRFRSTSSTDDCVYDRSKWPGLVTCQLISTRSPPFWLLQSFQTPQKHYLNRHVRIQTSFLTLRDRSYAPKRSRQFLDPSNQILICRWGSPCFAQRASYFAGLEGQDEGRAVASWFRLRPSVLCELL